jgi:hypothetical protein
METKRYSLRTAGDVLGMTAMAVMHRANRLAIDTSNGLTAADVKAIREYKSEESRYTKRNTVQELKRELEVLG